MRSGLEPFCLQAVAKVLRQERAVRQHIWRVQERHEGLNGRRLQTAIYVHAVASGAGFDLQNPGTRIHDGIHHVMKRLGLEGEDAELTGRHRMEFQLTSNWATLGSSCFLVVDDHPRVWIDLRSDTAAKAMSRAMLQ